MCQAFSELWLRKLNATLVPSEIVHPFRVAPPAKITSKHVRLLKQWDSVRDWAWSGLPSVQDSAWESVRDSVWDWAWSPVQDSVWGSVRASVGSLVAASVWATVRDSVRASVWDSVWHSVWAVQEPGRGPVWHSLRDSVRASVWAYTGSFFKIPKWRYIKHVEGVYPYLPLVKLWKAGLVPSFDGAMWRLHGGPKAAVLFSASREELQK